jgi:hypothetical protein
LRDLTFAFTDDADKAMTIKKRLKILTTLRRTDLSRTGSPVEAFCICLRRCREESIKKGGDWPDLRESFIMIFSHRN